MPGKQTMAYKILELIAILGELPSGQLSRLPGGEEYKKTLITSLKKQNLIRTYYRDSMRGYRLTGTAKKLLLNDNPERFSFCLAEYADTNHVQSELLRRMRLWRIAETTVTMKNANVSVFPDERPPVFSPNMNMTPAMDSPSFYSSRDVSAYGQEFMRTKGARYIGVLLSDTRVYIVYNLGDHLMKWAYKSEMRVKAQVSDIICRQRFPRQYSTGAVRGIIFANNIELAYDILANKGNKQYFILDGSYENFHFLTNDTKGETILKILCDTQLRENLNDILKEDLKPPIMGSLFEHDAMTRDGKPVLLAYDCDLRRISSFESILSIQEKTGVLICFDFQSNIIGRFCGERVKIQTIDYEKMKRSWSFFES